MSQTYNCKKCNFSTFIKFNYDRHCKTKKHINVINTKQHIKDKDSFICNNCNKEYIHYSSYYRHYKECENNIQVKNHIEKEEKEEKVKEQEEKKEEINDQEEKKEEIKEQKPKQNKRTKRTKKTKQTKLESKEESKSKSKLQSDKDKIKELEYKLEIEKIRSGMKDTEKILQIKELQFQKDMQIKSLEKELEIKDLKKELQLKELELKELENKTLLIVDNMKNNLGHTQYNITSNNISNINNNINNININHTMNKKNVLNMYFNNVIDIDTFTSNFKNEYGLTNEESKILMENYESMGINSYTSSLFHYLKTSAVRQYKALGVDMKTEEIVLPFVNSDASLRQHFEKDKSGEWKRTSNNDNIKRLIIISNDRVYKNHKKILLINPTQRKRISNAILKASNYSIITNHLKYKDSNILEIESDKFKNLFLKDKKEKCEIEEESDEEYEIISEDNFINNLNSLCEEEEDDENQAECDEDGEPDDDVDEDE